MDDAELTATEDAWTSSILELAEASPAVTGALVELLGEVGVPWDAGWRLVDGRRRRHSQPGLPDLLAIDPGGAVRAVLEVKFGASLTAHQPLSYLQHLEPGGMPGALVFIVSERQMSRLAAQVVGRLDSAGLLGEPGSSRSTRVAWHGGRALGLHDGRCVVLLPQSAFLNGITDRLGHIDVDRLRSQSRALNARWRGSFADIEMLLGLHPLLERTAESVGACVLWDWPYVGQRLHGMFLPGWRRTEEVTPRVAIGLGWHWGTRMSGGTSGNDNVRPYATVATWDKSVQGRLVQALKGPGSAARAAGRPSGTYPAWFWLDHVHDGSRAALEAEVGRALRLAWAAWAPAVGEVLDE